MGVLRGFDRLRLKGTIRMFLDPKCFENCSCHVMMRDFGQFAQRLTKRVHDAAYESFRLAGRPVEYLRGANIRKQDLAREIAGRDGISEGRIALFAAVEPCLSYECRWKSGQKSIHMELETRKCMHHYHYYMHPQFGLMHVRLQTWFPFTVEVCLNGRLWLARQMDHAGIGYQQRENCFVWLEDPSVLLERQSDRVRYRSALYDANNSVVA